MFEIVEDFRSDTYRAVYTVRFESAVYVLHAFQKKSTQGIKTPKKDVDLIEASIDEPRRLKMKKTKISVEQSSGNVFADLGLPNAELHLLKADLAIAIFQAIKQKKLTQEQAAELLGVEQPEISKLKNGNFSRFKVERLFDFLNKLGCNVDIRISRTKSQNPRQRVQLAA